MKTLKETRIEEGMTQEELAVKLGVNPRSVRRWENGEQIPARSTKKHVELFFGSKLHWEGEDE